MASQRASADVVARGAYLARAGDCVSCHTAPGGAPYAGGYRLDTPFGYLLAPNITPDAATGIGRWSRRRFLARAAPGRQQARPGHVPGDALRLLHPRHARGQRRDLCLPAQRAAGQQRGGSSTTCASPSTSAGRWRCGASCTSDEGSYKPDPAKSAAWNRGAYLVEGLGHCSACHSPRNALGGIEKDKAFTGATVDGWFALNLTSELHTGLGSWTVEQIATYLKTGAVAGKTTALGPMALVVKNSTSQMTDADLTAMATYLKDIPPNSTLRQGKPAPDPTRAAGGSLYLDHCAGCHQAGGRGMPGIFPPLAGNGVVLASDPADILKVVLHGIPPQGKYVPMPAFASLLSDQQVADLANYVRTSWGNAAAPNTTAAMATRIRAQTR